MAPEEEEEGGRNNILQKAILLYIGNVGLRTERIITGTAACIVSHFRSSRAYWYSCRVCTEASVRVTTLRKTPSERA